MLSDIEIKEEIEKGNIIITPFHEHCLRTNTYDVHLGDELAVYNDSILDCKKLNSIRKFKIPSDGFLLTPGEFYLGHTAEYTEFKIHVPFLEGKSSIGRLGIEIHATAGVGDVGFANFWTLEIQVAKPVKVYPYMPIGQLIVFKTGAVKVPYGSADSSKYIDINKGPVESRMYLNHYWQTDDWSESFKNSFSI